jgi:hypothetical protein
MGLLLGIFPPPTWTAYVAFAVLFDAIVMGRMLQARLTVALCFSLVTNLLTGVVGAGIGEVVFHGYGMDPNPFGLTLALVAGLAPVSGMVEGFVWGLKHWGTGRAQRQPLLTCIVVHLLAVPFSMIVLPSPPRPYAGLERQAGAARASWVRSEFDDALKRHINAHGSLPAARSYGEALQVLQPYLRTDRETVLGRAWVTEFRPEFRRFDTGEARREQMWEWNPAASGVRTDVPRQAPFWIMRRQAEDYVEGFAWTHEYGVYRATLPKELGY